MPEIPDVGAIAQQVKARIKHIEDQLKQHQRLNDELERLRDALSRLEGGARSRVGASAATPSPRQSPPPAPRAHPPRAASAPARATRTRAAKPATTPARAPRGQNKAKVLDALKGGPMTASEISKATGIPSGTASTLLSKMAKSGELAKADRGYKLPESHDLSSHAFARELVHRRSRLVPALRGNGAARRPVAYDRGRRKSWARTDADKIARIRALAQWRRGALNPRSAAACPSRREQRRSSNGRVQVLGVGRDVP